MRVGVLGGTFDPVHNGHLILAEQARAGIELDLVLFIPAGEPWRKADRAIAPAEHRLAMLRLAIAGNDAFGVSDIEVRRAGPTYTADTLETLTAERLDDQFWFVVGADALADLPNWHEPERIVRHATLAVAPRDGAAGIAEADSRLRGRIDSFAMPRIEISSSVIRARVAAGRSIRYLAPEAVRAYIEREQLYQ